MNEFKLCPKCRITQDTKSDIRSYSCDNCGEYEIEGRFARLDCLNEKDKAALSIMTRRTQELGKQKLFIDGRNYKDYIDLFHSFSPQDRANFLIEFVGNKTEYGEWFDLHDSMAFITASSSPQQLQYIRNHLKSEDILEFRDSLGSRVRLTFKGWERFEDISTRINSKLCFVAIPFSESNINLYKQHLKPFLKEELSFDSVIVSERQHNEDIVDRIIYEINRCRFVIADASEKNANVYYEAGYARGLGKTVIWICRKSEEGKIELPFDTRNINHIVWETEEDLKSQLKMRILATISVPENQNASTR